MSNQAGSDEKPAPEGVEVAGTEDAKLVKTSKNKFHGLAAESTKYLESLSPDATARVAFLKDLQRKHDELEAKFNEEKALLEAKYQKLYEPLYTKRADIISGVAEVEGSETQGAEGDSAAKGVPNFWLMALKTNELLAVQITERDEEALKYLKDIQWSKLDSLNGFKLDFHFNPNPFFKNAVLSKTYHMVDDDEPILERATGTEILWFPRKNLTQKLLRKKLKDGQTDAKPITKTKQIESFFNFFNPPQMPESEDVLDEDAAEELQDVLENDYDIGATIKEKIVPHAVSWFTGEALQGEENEDDEDEDEDEEADEEDEEEQDEDEDYEEINEGEAPPKA